MIRRLALAALLLSSTAASAQQISKPDPVPFENTIPEARDIAYPGTIEINVDATNTQQRIFTVEETIPVAKAGPMTLLYPKWIPGHHSPTGPIDKLAGLHITANGKDVAWTRDPVDVAAYHIDVPEGAKELKLSFQFLSPTRTNQGRVMMTDEMLSLQFDKMTLYPAGYYVRDIPVVATVKYPEGWTAASALRANTRGSTYAYEKTNYQVLVDSPIIAGAHYKKWALSPKVTLNAVADTAKELDATPEQIAAHKRLVEQAVKLYGAEHYDHYDFLLTISDTLGGIGLEHHRSSEDGVKTGYFTKWDDNPYSRNLLPHEYNHSWDGKYRRPADLWTPDYRMPMRDSGLWVYEGQDQFWGYVLQTRSGLVSKQTTLDEYALIASNLDTAPARQWRPLIDTTNDPIISQRRPRGWYSWQRSEDYYNEGLLVWMEVDSILREQSGGKKSLDDFARAFFGMNDGDWGELTYNFDDVVATLNSIVPYDWASLLKKRLTAVGAPAPLKGFERNGYKLVYNSTPNGFLEKLDKNRKRVDVSRSVGIVADTDGDISSVIWDSPAFKQGLDTGSKIVAVNGMEFSGDRMKDAITAAKGTQTPVRLLVKEGERYRDIAIDYHDGLRYPHLEKIGKGETGLDRLLAPK
ncbi:M61 family metallopeptidase [Stakelama marina]|uniref:M61 family metallopeptidase n=1 Tax=Stakelama marina TaxID=2826939 RepID=A0A8T4IKK2_9SPHN|nr:peptidase M61 [Stakelama marina]MBR0552889.1 M61 family metallopeptidase [Stakelama marina]